MIYMQNISFYISDISNVTQHISVTQNCFVAMQWKSQEYVYTLQDASYGGNVGYVIFKQCQLLSFLHKTPKKAFID